MRRMDEKNIHISHINVRTSISLLLLKLILAEVMTAIFIVVLHVSLLASGITLFFDTIYFVSIFFGILVFLKILLTIFLVLVWLNEYYEITSKLIYHRSGVIFETEKKFPLSHIGSIRVYQGIFGKIFNFGTISLYDPRRNKQDDMYLIHNPMRYATIIEELLPQAEEEKHTLRGSMVEEDKFAEQ